MTSTYRNWAATGIIFGLLFITSLGNGALMAVASVIAFLALLVFYRDELARGGWVRAIGAAVVAVVVAAGIALARAGS